MAEWTHRICEHCFWAGSAALPAPGVAADGRLLLPTQIITDPDETGAVGICCMCGFPCVTQIYFRADQNDLLCVGDHTVYDWAEVRIGN